MSTRNPSIPLSKNPHLVKWVAKMAALTKPDAIHWVDGSKEEYNTLCEQLVAGGTFTRLNKKKWRKAPVQKYSPSAV